MGAIRQQKEKGGDFDVAVRNYTDPSMGRVTRLRVAST